MTGGPAEGGAARLGGIEVVESPFVSAGTFLLAPRGALGPVADVGAGRLRLGRLWPRRHAAGTFADVVARERAIALDHLAGELDGLARAAGVGWREDRHDRTQREALSFDAAVRIAEERIALTLNRPADLFVGAFTP